MCADPSISGSAVLGRDRPLRARVLHGAACALVALGSGCGSTGDVAASAPGPTLPNVDSSLGYNLDFPGDWTNLPPFIDEVMNSRAPRGNCESDDASCDATSHLSLDSDGWPTTLRYRDGGGTYTSIDLLINSSDDRADIGQRFVATWEGDGSVAIMGGIDVEREDQQRRLAFTLGGEETIVRLSDIDLDGSGDYLRNVRVFRADFEASLQAGEVFNPDMLEFLRPFRSIRFMDWMQSNAYGQCSGGPTPGAGCYAVTSPDCGEGGRCVMPGHWQERPTENAPSRLASGQYLDVAAPALGTKVGGYALETLVALANRVPADPHFNLPVDYDEDYVRRFAEYLRDHLALGLTATVEYSNEVWNWQFPQAQYANQLGRQQWPDEGSAWVQFAASRTHTACKIIKEVFAGQEQRVRCLLSPQTGYRGLAQAVLDCPAWAADHPGEGPCSRYVDAVSITGYFAGCLVYHPEAIERWLDAGQERALDSAFQQLEHGGLIDECSGDDEDSLDRAIDNYRFYGELAASRGLGLYVYESGTHFNFDGDERVRDFLVDMTRDERMYDLYTKNFLGFKDHGGSVLNVWGWIAPDDMWANAESVLDRTHPKYRAIRDFAVTP